MNAGSSGVASTSNAEAGTNSLQSISGDLWSRILDSVKGSRGVGTKQCIVLGAPNSGKSTLIRRISTTNGELAVNGETRQKTLDLGMSYSVLEVKDEGSGDEETLARLSIYQLPSPSPPYPALLPLSLSKKTLLDSLVVIVLDWERPWSFVRELKEWIAMLEHVLKNEVGTDTFELTEARERLDSQLRSYHEPSSTTNGSIQTPATTSTTAATIDMESPLPPGTLVNNLGLGIVVVCTKADHINTLEREREFTEEQFDYIQQTLRTVCLRYGASLFFTSQTIPNSFTQLRQYILHRIFSPSSLALNTASVPPTSTRAFPFQHRTNVIDRDQILVPTGWDSWGKIRILREKFDCEKVGEGWEEDLNRTREASGEQGEGEGAGHRLQKEYEMVVVDFDSEDKPTSSSTLVTPHDEQSFLQTHYAALQADLEKDPRLAFRQPANPSSSSSTSSSVTNGMRHGGVGPMAGSIGDLPNVQGALDRASGGGSTSQRGTEKEASGRERERDRGSASGRSALGMSRQGSASASLPSRSPILSQSTNTPSSAVPSGSTGGAAGSAAGGNQVLADFFQSLLTARSGSGSGTASPVTGGAAGGTGLRRPSENEKVTASNGEAK